MHARAQRRRRLATILFAAPLLASPVAAAPTDITAEHPVLRSGWGVSYHPTPNADADFAAMAAAGVRIVRTDLDWAHTEPRPGHYDWSHADALVARMGAHGLRPLLILDYSNPAYEPSLLRPGQARMQAAPRKPDTRAAFARWAAAAAVHFRAAKPILEIWNEPNQDRFWLPESSAASYADLAAATCKAIRMAAADTMILAPGLSNSPAVLPASAFLDEVARSPAGACVSAISVHPYLFMGAIDQGANWWGAVRAHLAAAGVNKPLVNSESGLSTYSGRLTDMDQASYLVRMFVADNAAGVPISIWYDWRDDGTAPDDPEHHFGLTAVDGRPKPAYRALKALTNAIGGADRLCYIAAADLRRAYFRDGTARTGLLVAWNTAFRSRSVPAEQQPTTVTLPAGARAIGATDMLGQPAAFTATGADIRFTQGRAPFLIRYSGPPPANCTAPA